ncbi:spermidine/putrescine ABC transporter permease [Paenibacillus marchantiophytorum]|uniref:Spermidine/putrescine ABC transporter permease n=1 Tax=Paenibacillus marchantiophytorum TaxID=1619310 RepID=A0ABQ1FGK4_9BACL|nr:sugar ABC transporter permease [Paenibacillus marchantiophytorum]GGA11843.1 spermidine/putrescine ABC transporter permease [Paenibacillus marchantiophytorum]
MLTRNTRYFYFFIMPWLIGALVFMVFPIISSLYFSFTEYDIIHSPKWIGLKNYTKMFHDELFWRGVKATLIFTVFSVPLQLILSLLFAVLVNQKVPFRRFFRTALYFPSMISGVALSLLWLWVFNSQTGMMNYMLGLVGIDGPSWLESERWALAAMVIMTMWGAGAGMIIFLAALQGVPTYLYEAARLEGASRWQMLRSITLPAISPVILFQLIMGINDSFQVFTQAFVMTKGGPHYATQFYVYYLWQNGFKFFKMGYASALAWVLLILVMVMTYLVMKISKRYVHYEGGDGA